MKLMTKELEERFKKYPLYSQDGLGGNAKVIAKYFNPVGAGTWLITEGNKLDNGDYKMFGYCNLGDDEMAELGYVMLSDLENIKLPFGLKIERDLYLDKNITLAESLRANGFSVPSFLSDGKVENNQVYVICYNSLNIFPSKESAKSFFSECYYMTEGAEHERYGDVLLKLEKTNLVIDNISDSCIQAVIRTNDNEDDLILVEFGKFLSFDDSIKYYEEKIKPILELSDDYGINFYSKLPFEHFGSDEENSINYSFSDYYKSLLEKFGVNVDNIYTNNWSDGKYKLMVNNNEFKITAWDNLSSVIDNIDSIVELSKNEELEM